MFTIFGASGFIGSHLVVYLKQQGYECYTPAKGDESIFSKYLGHVIYAIGLTSDFRNRPLETVEAHVCLLRRLLVGADFTSLTYLSSTRVYAHSSVTDEQAVLTVNPNEPEDLYNISKLMGESMVLHSGRERMKVARLSNVIGLRDDDDMFISQLLKQGCSTGHLTLYSTSDSKKDYIHIDDVTKALESIALISSNGIYNVASGIGTSNKEIISALESHMGFQIDIDKGAKTLVFQEISIQKSMEEFGFRPRLLSEYFLEFLDQYLDNKGLK